MNLYWRDKHDVTTHVGDLIKELQKFDPNAPVYTQGCDCYGNVVAVVQEKDGTVSIERDDNIFQYRDGGMQMKDEYRDRVVRLRPITVG